MKTNFFAHVAIATSLLIFLCISSAFTHINSPAEKSQEIDAAPTACWGDFSPKSEWSSLYPDCSVSVTADDCNKSPSVQFSGGPCYPSSGEIEIGTITVYQDLTPLYVYGVSAVYGTVVIVLIEEL